MNKRGQVDQALVGILVSVVIAVSLIVFVVLAATIFALNGNANKGTEIAGLSTNQVDSMVLGEAFLSDTIYFSEREFAEIAQIIEIEEQMKVRDYIELALYYESARGQIDINEYNLLFGIVEDFFIEKYSCLGENYFILGYYDSGGNFKRVIDYPENPLSSGNLPLQKEFAPKETNLVVYLGSGRAVFDGGAVC